MKRLFCAFTVLFLLVLTACDGNKKPFADAVPPTVPAFFSADMRIVRNGGEMTANIVRDRNGVTEITVITPEDIGGLSLRFGNETGSLSYGNMSVDIDYSRFPETAVFKLLLDALKQLSIDTGISVSKTNAGWEYVLTENGNEKVTVIQNAGKGFLESVSFPSYDLLITFSDFKEITENGTE